MRSVGECGSTRVKISSALGFHSHDVLVSVGVHKCVCLQECGPVDVSGV